MCVRVLKVFWDGRPAEKIRLDLLLLKDFSLFSCTLGPTQAERLVQNFKIWSRDLLQSAHGFNLLPLFTVAPKTGRALVFIHDTRHAGLNIEAGTKHISSEQKSCSSALKLVSRLTPTLKNKTLQKVCSTVQIFVRRKETETKRVSLHLQAMELQASKEHSAAAALVAALTSLGALGYWTETHLHKCLVFCYSQIWRSVCKFPKNWNFLQDILRCGELGNFKGGPMLF
jgi:hypothetical protein